MGYWITGYPTKGRRKRPHPSSPQPPPLRGGDGAGYPTGATLAPIRLANAASQLPYGSGKTTGEASPHDKALTEADGTHTMMIRGVTWFDIDWWIIGGKSYSEN
jgi:hypothetical protein